MFGRREKNGEFFNKYSVSVTRDEYSRDLLFNSVHAVNTTVYTENFKSTISCGFYYKNYINKKDKLKRTL